MSRYDTNELARGRVLVVEDDPAIRMLLQLTLQRMELDVWTAHNGVEALDILRERSFDVLMLDFMMPGMTGLELSSWVRHSDPTVPIALLSGCIHLVTEHSLTAAGITQTFTKPFDIKTVTDWVDSVLPCHA